MLASALLQVHQLARLQVQQPHMAQFGSAALQGGESLYRTVLLELLSQEASERCFSDPNGDFTRLWNVNYLGWQGKCDFSVPQNTGFP